MGRKKTRIDLPLPKTSKKKWFIYLDIEEQLEIFLFNGQQIFTPEFPEEPVVNVVLKDGIVLTSEQLISICHKIMKKMKVEYNKEFKVWEAVFVE